MTIFDSKTDGALDIKMKVKPCPFCGNAEKLFVSSRINFEELYKDNGDACITLRCYRCNCELAEHEYHGPDYGFKLGVLLTKWNNRRDV